MQDEHGYFYSSMDGIYFARQTKTGAIPSGMAATEQNFSAPGYLRYYHTPIINQ
jgi:hypothetical protein